VAGKLIYDGDCGFCRQSVARWRKLTADSISAVPYQEAAAEFPNIPVANFQRSVHYIEDHQVWTGAEAIFESLRDVPGYGWLCWSYRHVPLFAALSDLVYREVAGHRKTATRFTRILWGAPIEEPTYRTSVWIFQRALALIYLIAFVSFAVQVRGLIGSQGILPAGQYFQAVRASEPSGIAAFLDAPSLFWWSSSDAFLVSVCWIGAGLAIVSALGFFVRPVFAALFVLYLSLTTAGQVFMGYQWDFLLLEAGFLAIFLTPSWPRVWLFHWLLFRLMFESAAVKLLSHDPTWANLTALNYHFQTQPLPTVLAWYAAQAPLWLLKFSTGSVFFIEGIVPFLIFGPRRMKQFAAVMIVLLQVLIFLTGNYTFFNLLTISLCILLIDDRFWGRLSRGANPSETIRSRLVTATLFAVVLVISCTELTNMFSRDLFAPARRFAAWAAPFGIVNSYGLFANMTTLRIEIDVQGSLDGETWQSYVFPDKPGDIHRRPGWVAPYQPRLDWQMWFAALGNYQQNPWFGNFAVRLLTASPDVLHLLAYDPFGGRPPKFVRSLAYEYKFTTFVERNNAHIWWRRDLKGLYLPPVSLRN
jgi:predicted DCC family thiol-disulfide oxidoreductase YuxK